MHYVYVLISEKDKKWYIGCTSDLRQRLFLHNKGRVQSTKSRRPLHVLYQEQYEDKYEAYTKEQFYKTAKGKKELKKKIESI